MNGGENEPIILGPGESLPVWEAPIFHNNGDGGGLLGPHEEDVTEIVGEKMEMHLQVPSEKSIFRNPFGGGKKISNEFVGNHVYKCELQSAEKGNRQFTMFSILHHPRAVQCFATTSEHFDAFRDEKNQFAFRSTFGQPAGTELENCQTFQLPLEHIFFRKGIAYLEFDGKKTYIVNELAVMSFLKHKLETWCWNSGTTIFVAGYPSRFNIDKMVLQHTLPDKSVGWQDAKLTVEQFKTIVNKTLGLPNTLVVSKGKIQQDSEHIFANTNRGMRGGPVCLFKDGTCIGVNLGYDDTCKLVRFAPFAN